MHAGDIVDDKFRLERPLKHGGSGTVWVAHHLVLEIDVAVKLLKDDAATPKQIARFRREAGMIARLDGPHVVRLYDFGLDGDRPYMVMELLQGEDIRARLQRCGRMSLREATDVVRQVGCALRQAHALGLIHRDLKPANLFAARVAGEEVIKVLDFGIAKDVESDLEEAATTKGTVLGTPAYMAPEQARGDEVDPRTDLWSLAVVLLELVTGRNPFRGVDLLDTLARIAWKPLPVPSLLQPGLPGALDTFMERALTRAKTGRFATVEQFLAALAVAAGAPAGSASPRATTSFGRDDATIDVPSSALRLASLVESHPPPSARPLIAPLTADEERLACSLVVRGFWDALAGSSGFPSWDELVTRVDAFEGTLARVPGGDLLVTFVDNLGAREQARLAAYCAFSVERMLPTGRIAIVVGRRSAARGAVEIDARTSTLLDASAAGIRVDGDAASLLGEPFIVELDASGLGVLRGVSVGGSAPLRRLVGRRSELETLLGAAEDCRASGSLRSVLVTGAPGVGKTRLLQELAAMLAQGQSAFDVWYGRADRTPAETPFALLGDVIRRRLGAGADAHLYERLHRYAAQLLSPEDAVRVAGFLGEIIVGSARVPVGPQLSAARVEPRLMFEQTVRAFVDLVRAHPPQRPLAIVADQLHAADSASLGALAALGPALGGRPLLVLGAAHDPSLLPRFVAPGSVAPLWLEIGPLTAEAATELVRDLAGEGEPTTTTRAIVERGLGNPLLLEELARLDHPDAAGAGTTSVLALAEARILALPAGARQVLRAASVFGGSFSEAGLRELLRVEADQLGRELAVLAANGVIEPSGAPGRSAPSEWAFRHMALRDAAYEMIPASDREAAHRAAGYFLEGLATIDAATLAEHFDRGGRARRAARHYGEAARRALMGNDVTGALRLGERGVELMPGPEGADALLAVVESLHSRGEMSLALERAVEAMRVLPRGTPRWLTAASLAAMAASRLGEHRICANIAGEILEMPAPGGDAPNASEFISACARVGHVLFVQSGQADLAREVLMRAELTPPVTERDQPLAYAMLCRARSYLAHRDQDLRSSWRWLDDCARAFQVAGDRRSAAMAIANRAHIQYQSGMNGEAADGLSCALDLVGETAPFNRAILHENLGAALARLGRHDEAIAALRESIRVFTELGDLRAAAGSRTYLAPLLAATSPAEAFDHARRAVVDAAVQPPLEAYARGVLSRLELAHGDPVEALAQATRANEIVAELGTLVEGEAMVRLALVEALERTGDTAASARELRALFDLLAAQASRIRDPALQRAFWDDVPEHREARALALDRLSISP